MFSSGRDTAHSSQGESQLHIFEDNEAVIKLIIQGINPTLRHVSRIRGVTIDWLFDRINLYPRIQIKNVDTKNQLANLTKRSVTRDEWNHHLHLLNIMNLSTFSCSHFFQIESKTCRMFLSKRRQVRRKLFTNGEAQVQKLGDGKAKKSISLVPSDESSYFSSRWKSECSG